MTATTRLLIVFVKLNSKALNSSEHVKQLGHNSDTENRQEKGAVTHDVEHEVVSQGRGAVNPHQNAVLQRGAEAHGQPVRARAWPLISRPVKGDKTSPFTEDIGCSSYKRERTKDNRRI